MADANLMKYLEHVLSLEKASYVQKNTIDALEQYAASLGHKKTFTHPQMYNEDAVDFDAIFTGGKAGVIIGAIVGIFRGNFLSSLLIGALIGSVAIGIWAVCVVTKTNNQRFDNYNSQLQAYDAAVKADDDRVEHELKEKPLIFALVDQLKEKQQHTLSCLQTYYDLNIIFPKYRNFISISSIYEYLLSERCSKLTGYEGAYNTLENEIRFGIVVKKLDEVIGKLDEIKQNQSILYNAICDGNRLTQQLLNQAIAQTRQLEYLAEQSAITAYNTQQAANEERQTKWLLWYHTFLDK